MSDSSQYSQGSQSSAPQQQLRRLASPTQDRPPHEIVRPRLEESATREAVRAADQLQPDEQPAEQPANERANAPVNEPARQGDQQANQPPNEPTERNASASTSLLQPPAQQKVNNWLCSMKLVQITFSKKSGWKMPERRAIH
ncbi:hypothetical protein CAOG_08001 [Capsaspora owczarzaki ATCC 30864]|uniref:hypothetical protein n=1 Tax=Capsaspora owczarzaki (strain ATCC 30864) TaxID=595528 RepID=UPI0001FE284F|nr:hypothetical protein CAOG_08001 [Capsaspora owczarzaki ATCC 30864]|eukprot:XP_004342602.1 hypothetical protein CAOG_08001 [Capsaspora owczarzaki ATCC 30864]